MSRREHRIERLERRVEELLAVNEALRSENATLRARVAELEEQLRVNSQNSSKPPSSDPPSAPPKHKRTSSGRAPGGQPGHERHERALLPPERVTRVRRHAARCCVRCQSERLLFGAEPSRRHQVIEIPEIRPDVTEDQYFDGTCHDCGHVTPASLVADVAPGGWGPRLIATIGLLTGAYRMSRRNAEQFLEDVLGIPIALGSVSKQEQVVSAAIAAPVAEAHRAAQNAPIAHVDETGWRLARAKAWMWVMVTGVATVFKIHPRRNREAARELLGEFSGVIVTDRWKVYDAWALWCRQLCWAHLRRDCQRMVERGGASAKIGRGILKATGPMFGWHRRVRDGTLQHATLRAYMRTVQRTVEALLERGVRCAQANTAGTCREILVLRPALWAFVDDVRIAPTNNTAEQRVRGAVIWRKTSFGTHSDAGARYAERMLTVVHTLRQHGRNVYQYLIDAVAAHIHHETAPSLLPHATADCTAHAA